MKCPNCDGEMERENRPSGTPCRKCVSVPSLPSRYGRPGPICSRVVVDKNGDGKWVDDQVDVLVPQDEEVREIVSVGRAKGHEVFEIASTPPLLCVTNRLLSMNAVANIQNCLDHVGRTGKALVLEDMAAVFQLVDGRWKRLPANQPTRVSDVSDPYTIDDLTAGCPYLMVFGKPKLLFVLNDGLSTAERNVIQERIVSENRVDLPFIMDGIRAIWQHVGDRWQAMPLPPSTRE